MVKQYLTVFISIVAQLYSFAILARVIISWTRMSFSANGFTQMVYEVTEPLLGFYRRYIPPLGGVIDLSPIAAFFTIDILSDILIRIISHPF